MKMSNTSVLICGLDICTILRPPHIKPCSLSTPTKQIQVLLHTFAPSVLASLTISHSPQVCLPLSLSHNRPKCACLSHYLTFAPSVPASLTIFQLHHLNISTADGQLSSLLLSRSVVPNLFCLKGHLFFMEGIEGHKVNFFTYPTPLLPPFSSPHSPPVQQLGVLRERCKLPQRGLGWSPSRQRILEHSRATSDRFLHVPRDFAAFQATRNF